MTVELKKGYIIDSYYDKNTRSYITTLKDNEGNQIRDAYYSGNMTDRNSDIQHIKEFFYKYMDSKTGTIQDEDVIDDEVVEESLKSKIIETKKKTKKAKLPALSTLSPIMPDGAAGIATFNSGVGLSEEYLNREELINRISKMGFKYKFDKYSDAALYRIYQERLRELERRKKAKREKKQRADELENKRVNSQDSYFENGIEFESEDAAREYFGESMNNFEDTARVRDITAWAFSKDLDLDTAIKVVERQMKKEGSIIPNNLRSIVYACWDDLSADYDNEYFEEAMDNKIYLNDIHKAWGLNEGWMSNELYDKWGDDPESLRIEEVEPGYFTVFSHDGNSTYYFGDSKEDCIDWCEDNGEKYFLYNEIYESKENKHKKVLNESMNNHEKTMKAFLQKLMRIKYKDFDFASHLIDDYDIIIKPDVNNSLDLDNKEIILNRELSPEDAIFTIIKLFREKNVINQSGKFVRSHNFKTITEGLKYFERKEFSENCKDAELELLYEGVKNNLDQEDIKKLGNFLKKADSADDVATFIKGLLSEDMDYDTSGNYDSDGDAYNTHYMPPEDEWDAYFTSDYYEDGDDYLNEDMDLAKDNLFYKAYDARPELMEDILEEFGYTPDTCETLEDIPTDIRRKAFSMWLKEARELAKWNDEMDSQVYDIIDLVDSSNLYESLNEALKDTRIKSYDTKFGTFIIRTREGKSRRTNYMTGKKEWMPVKSTLGYFKDFPLAVEFFLYRDGQDRYVSSSQGRRSDEWVEFLNARDYSEALHITEREVVKCFQDYYEDSSIY